MRINYRQQEKELEIGRPYTNDVGEYWYIRVSVDAVVFLGTNSEAAGLLDPGDCSAHILCATSWPTFRYADFMEIK